MGHTTLPIRSTFYSATSTSANPGEAEEILLGDTSSLRDAFGEARFSKNGE